MTLSQGLGLILTVAGAGATLEQAILLDRALRSAGWPCVPGRVLGARVGGLLTSLGRGAVPMYGPDVTYEYEVNGQTYQSRTHSFIGYVSGKSAGEVVRGYRPGVSVPVYYDPANPSRAVLVPGAPLGAWLRAAAAGVLLFVGLHYLLSAA